MSEYKESLAPYELSAGRNDEIGAAVESLLRVAGRTDIPHYMPVNPYRGLGGSGMAPTPPLDVQQSQAAVLKQASPAEAYPTAMQMPVDVNEQGGR